MLTPRFEITQTDGEVCIVVHAPYANIKDAEVYVDGNDFRFYATPYYLRLKLPGEIEENDSSTGSYDCEKGEFRLRFSKVNKGEYFENLDMITTLLAPPKKKSTVLANIEVIGNPSVGTDGGLSSDEESVGTNGDEWYHPQELPNQNITIPGKTAKYGFANKVSNAFLSFEPCWIKEIIDLPEPDFTPRSDRKSRRKLREQLDFNEEHYMADFMERDCVEPYINYEPPWQGLSADDVTFTDQEADILKELPNKEYLLNEEEVRMVLLGMADILFAYCYNVRTTMAENTVESGWTVNKLSSTLSWFEDFSEPKEVMIASIRRSLCYPLFRNWELSMKVFDDVKQVVKLGKKYIIKIFCEVHSLFNNSCEPRYILNKLYIKDYLIWLQQTNSSLLSSLDSFLSNVSIEKKSIGFNLEELEAAAYSVQQEEDLVIENSVQEIVEQMDGLAVEDFRKPKLSSSDSDSYSDSDSDSDSSTTSNTTTTTSSSSSSSSNTDLDSDDVSEEE